jgi:hypothetical protein
MIICITILTLTTFAYANNQPSLPTPNEKQMENAKALIVKHFPEKLNEDNIEAIKIPNTNNVKIKTSDAYYIVDNKTNNISDARFLNVPLVGMTKKIDKSEAHKTAIEFLKKHYTEVDIDKYIEKSSFQTNYVLNLKEIDKETNTKLLGYITVIINQETGEVAYVNYCKMTPPTSLKISIYKEAAQVIADNAVQNEFIGAKLVRSSETPVVKLISGTDKQVVGWTFIYESEEHSAAILVDGNNGDTIIQRAY